MPPGCGGTLRWTQGDKVSDRGESVRTVHVRLADGRVLRAGRACLYMLHALGYRRLATLLALPTCIWLVEVGYSLVAKQRPCFARWLFTRA